MVHFRRKVRLRGVREVFGPYHAEPTRSAAAREYVQKEDTRIAGTQFELGSLPMRRSERTDWDAVKASAQSGRLDSIPSDVFIRCYNQLRRVQADFATPVAVTRRVWVFWGCTGTGKSRRAWGEAGMDAYPKDPRTKFWDGYRSHKHVVMDEFRGAIDIGHILRWFDRYPVLVEVKGSAAVLVAEQIWITSNLDPRLWYPDTDEETKAALMRRLSIVHFPAVGSNE